ncbi:hypothetical protein ACVQ8P_04275 [Dellaglioa sp. BT-FLS60]
MDEKSIIDERLIDRKFTIDSQNNQGTVVFFGIYYHYFSDETLKIGDTVQIIKTHVEGLDVKKI